MDGYQSGDPGRVDAIAAAVYEAMRDRDIRYAEPPASWGTGQKVRTPQEVLDGRVGTCLDTALTMAAVLEQAGIGATLWLLPGHIFLGYWRSERTLDTAATTDIVPVVNLVEIGDIGLIETTMITGGPTASRPFAEAVAAPRLLHLGPSLSEFIAITDIATARKAGILPLPSRSVASDGTIVVTNYTPAARGGRTPDVLVSGRPGSRHDPVPARVAGWKNALLDLSLRNRLINYTDRSGFRVDLPGGLLGALEDHVNANRQLTLMASDQVAGVDAARGIRFGRDLDADSLEQLFRDKSAAYIDITAKSYTAKLRYLANKARTIVEETGSNNLYLAFGMLRWTFNDRELRSPLVLVPVSLSTTSRGQTYRLAMDEAGMSTPNYCLLEKLRVSFGLEIPGLAEPAEDQSGIDLDGALEATRRAIDTAGVGFRVENTVDLSILQFAKFPLWRDLDTSWSALAQNSLVNHLIENPLKPFGDPVTFDGSVDLDELSGLVPTPADSSQLDAVAAAVGGQTFVLQGPPGTGKSQTITNLLARALQTGRRVLFVAEKRAALDVVRARLDEIGLGELSLDLHDKAARPAAVRAQIRVALDLHTTVDRDLLRTNQETLSAGRGALGRYATRLHDTNAAALSLYSAVNRALATDSDGPVVRVPQGLVAGAPEETLERIRGCLRSLSGIADLAHPERHHPWGFLSEPDPARLNGAAIFDASRRFDDALMALHREGVPIERIARHQLPEQLDRWAQVAAAPRFDLDSLDSLRSRASVGQLRHIDSQVANLQANPPPWMSMVGPRIMDRDVAAIHTAAVAADNSGFFGRKKRRQAVLDQLADVLVENAPAIDLKQLSTVTAAMLETHARVSTLRTAVHQVPIPLVQSAWNPLVVADAQTLRNRIGSIQAVNGLLGAADDAGRTTDLRLWYQTSAQGAAAQSITDLARARRLLDEVTDHASSRCPGWLDDWDFVTRWWQTRESRRLDSDVTLVRWLALSRHLEILRQTGLQEARQTLLTGAVPADDAALALDRGIALSSIAERREATGLSHFDAPAHQRAVERFANSGKYVRGELRRAIPAAVLERRRFDATDERGQMGGLRRQLDRQRGGMSVRKLLDTYGELITQILPCTLMSPESVARFFPPRGGLFDIVVFDEASQIRVADAVGAMGRARSAVVVGDSKQMPPTSFAEVSVSIDEDEEYSAESIVDEESILNECVQAQVPSKWLSWHYRSQDEALIAFSNVNYYDNRLSSFPAPLDGSAPDRDHGVSFVRVDGSFNRGGTGRTLRTNQVEADAIVDDIRRRFDDASEGSPSIGVITFNAQQRDLIDNLLRDSGNDRIVRALDAPNGLFVKNLENVQGDERDVILFSVAFSANDKGVVPLNFGPLSRPGGERRLNVAITRARRQVVLYASFDPANLRAEQTTQVGTKHLKAYLELAAGGVAVMAADGRREPVVDRHRDQIAERLRAEGLIVMTDVGLSEFRIDIAIADPERPARPVLAVLLDGPNWRARRTVADRDGLPVDVLKGLMRWPAVERIWLPEWMADPEAIVARLRDSLEKAPTGNPPAPVDHDSVRTAPTVRIPAEVAATPPTRVPTPPVPLRSAPNIQKRAANPLAGVYEEWRPGYLGSVDVLDSLPGQRAAATVSGAVQQAVDAEGPIHPDRLARIVAAAFGLQRVTDERKRTIQRLVPVVLKPEDGEGFYWPTSIRPDEWRKFRTPSLDGARPLEQVPLIEIANAMAVEAERSAGMSADELKRAALNLLGGRRITAAIGQRLDAALAVAVRQRRVRMDGGVYYPAPVQ